VYYSRLGFKREDLWQLRKVQVCLLTYHKRLVPCVISYPITEWYLITHRLSAISFSYGFFYASGYRFRYRFTDKSPKKSELFSIFNTPVPFKNIGFLFTAFAQYGGIALWFGFTQDKFPTRDDFRGTVRFHMKS